MPLHLVGETIDKTRSHYLAETGRLVQLMRGIYVDAAHPARVAKGVRILMACRPTSTHLEF